MKRYLAIIAFLLCVPFLFGMLQLVPVWEPVPAGDGATYPDILYYNGFEDNSSPYYSEKPSDKAFTLTGDAAVNGDHKVVGTYSLDCPNDASYATVAVTSEDIINWDTGRVGFYLTITTFADWSRLVFAQYNDDTEESGFYMNLRGSSSDAEVGLYYNGVSTTASLVTTAADMVQGNTYFIEALWDNATPSFKIFVDGVERATSTTSTGVFGNDPQNIRIGLHESGVAGDIAIDQLLISNDTTRDLNAVKDLTSFPDS